MGCAGFTTSKSGFKENLWAEVLAVSEKRKGAVWYKKWDGQDSGGGRLEPCVTDGKEKHDCRPQTTGGTTPSPPGNLRPPPLRRRACVCVCVCVRGGISAVLLLRLHHIPFLLKSAPPVFPSFSCTMISMHHLYSQSSVASLWP